jgi:hypothetical protein
MILILLDLLVPKVAMNPNRVGFGSSEDEEDRELERQLTAAGDNLNQIMRILQNDLNRKLPFDADVEDDARLEIMVEQFEAHESLYLKLRKANLVEDDYIEDDEFDDRYPRYRFLNFCDELPLGYDSSLNAYELVCLDSCGEIHGRLARTRPAIKNFDTKHPVLTHPVL